MNIVVVNVSRFKRELWAIIAKAEESSKGNPVFITLLHRKESKEEIIKHLQERMTLVDTSGMNIWVSDMVRISTEEIQDIL